MSKTKFSIGRTELYKKLSMLSGVIANKNIVKAFDDFLFEIEEDAMSITASDEEVRVKTKVKINDVKQLEVAKFSVYSKNLLNALKEMPEQPVTFDLKENGQLDIVYQNGKYKLISNDGDEYPEQKGFEKEKNIITINSDKLYNSLEKALGSVANDELRPVMNGVFFDFKENLILVSSDGHKLSKIKRTDIKCDFNDSFILPKKPAILLKRFLSKGDIQILFNKDTCVIKDDVFEMQCRLIEGRFPNYESVIPYENPIKIELDRNTILNALKRVSVFANKSTGLIILNIEDGVMTIIGEDMDFSTSAEEKLRCDYSGDNIKIGFKSVFLIDLLNNVTSSQITMTMKGFEYPALILPKDNEEGEELTQLIMPMAINE